MQGLGIALARRMLAEPLIDSGRLVVLTRKQLESGFAHYLVYPGAAWSIRFCGDARVAAGASRTAR